MLIESVILFAVIWYSISGNKYNGKQFLAHHIRISEILPCDRNSYLTHVILPRLSGEGLTLVVLDLKHMVVK